MLREGDNIFCSERDDARPEKRDLWKNSPEWRLQGREKGFVPYWWDEGGSVSLERLSRREPLAHFPERDVLADQPNPDYRLCGYSFGSSNHKAQDLACMLLLAWGMLHRSDNPADQKMAEQIAEAARHPQACRTRHGAAAIPIVLAAGGLTNGDTNLPRRVPQESWQNVFSRSNQFHKTMTAKPGQKVATPGFADDLQYRCYTDLAVGMVALYSQGKRHAPAVNSRAIEPMREATAFWVVSDAWIETK